MDGIATYKFVYKYKMYQKAAHNYGLRLCKASTVNFNTLRNIAR